MALTAPFRTPDGTFHEDADPNVKWTAIRTLAENPPAQALPVFVENFESEDWLIREASITGILRIKEESLRARISPLVIRALQDTASGVRIAALNNMSFRDESFYRLIAAIFMKTRTLRTGSLRRAQGHKGV